MTLLRRLDHVAILVTSTDQALRYFRGRLGLAVVHSEELQQPPVWLTYLDTGNAFLQLVEPREPDSAIGRALAEHGEGVHHICFGVDDVATAVRELSEPGFEQVPPSQGRGRPSGFVANGNPHGVRIECTQFSRTEDAQRRGWLEDGP